MWSRRQQLLTNNITKVDYILFTHEHADHTAGLDDVRPISFKMEKFQFMLIKSFGKFKASVFILVRETEDYAGDTHLIPNEVQENKTFNLHNFKVKPFHIHHKLQVFGFRISDFAYITDLKN